MDNLEGSSKIVNNKKIPGFKRIINKRKWKIWFLHQSYPVKVFWTVKVKMYYLTLTTTTTW